MTHQRPIEDPLKRAPFQWLCHCSLASISEEKWPVACLASHSAAFPRSLLFADQNVTQKWLHVINESPSPPRDVFRVRRPIEAEPWTKEKERSREPWLLTILTILIANLTPSLGIVPSCRFQPSYQNPPEPPNPQNPPHDLSFPDTPLDFLGRRKPQFRSVQHQPRDFVRPAISGLPVPISSTPASLGVHQAAPAAPSIAGRTASEPGLRRSLTILAYLTIYIARCLPPELIVVGPPNSIRCKYGYSRNSDNHEDRSCVCHSISHSKSCCTRRHLGTW